MKCWFEVASICPPSTDGSLTTRDEGCRATTLLPRLNIPDEPIRRDEEDEPERRARDQSRGGVAREAAGGSESNKRNAEPKGLEPKLGTDGEESKEVSSRV